MNAQAAMWVFDHSLGDWRYYLVTSLVDSQGRKATYRNLIKIFGSGAFPEDMTVDDVHLGSPTDAFFQTISRISHIQSHHISFENCSLDGIVFDGIVYRVITHVPDEREARDIEKTFQSRIREHAGR